jgi:hypothetical protein
MNELWKQRLGPVLAIAFTAGLVLSPITQNWNRKPKDNFPLSYYPMFSAVRGETYTSPAMVGWTAAGERRVVPYTFAGSGGLNEVRRQLRSRIQDRKAEQLCRKVAKRVARSARPDMAGVERLQVVMATHNLDAYFHGDKRAVKEKVYAACPVLPQENKEQRQ